MTRWMQKGTMFRRWLPSLLVGLALAVPAAGEAAQISGDYVEARSADVWTGPCFANSETGLLGQEAILAWRVREGKWNGVGLDGLAVVGVVKANATLGDPFENPYPARTVLIVDQRATPDQRSALVALAHEMGGELFRDVVRTESAPIEMQVASDHSSKAVLSVGEVAELETRGVGEQDKHCGNESVYYPPLTPTDHAMPAVSVIDRYSGPGLGVSWTTHNKRSAFVGSFSR
jgi:hypothetical protein